MKTQPDHVLDHLKAGKSISTVEAIGLFGHIQLAHAVHKLRKRGHDIRTKRIKHMNGKTYAQYKLEVPKK